MIEPVGARDYEKARMELAEAKIFGRPFEHLRYPAWCEGWTAMALYHIAFLIKCAASDELMPWGEPPDVDDQFRAEAKARFPEWSK